MPTKRVGTRTKRTPGAILRDYDEVLSGVVELLEQARRSAFGQYYYDGDVLRNRAAHCRARAGWRSASWLRRTTTRTTCR
jgi:hypothetical protein